MILVDQPISAYYPIVGNLGQGKVVRGQFTRGKDLVKSKQECLIKITIYCLQFEL